MGYSPSDIVKIAKISEYLAADDIAKGPLFGQRGDGLLAKKIYIERKSVEFMNSQNPNDSGLLSAANYLYTLCGKYALKAATLIQSSTNTAAVNFAALLPGLADLEVVVDVDGPTGGTNSWALPVSSIGFYARLKIDKIPQATRNWDGVSYSKPINSNTLTLIGGKFQSGSLIQIEFYR